METIGMPTKDAVRDVLWQALVDRPCIVLNDEASYRAEFLWEGSDGGFRFLVRRHERSSSVVWLDGGPVAGVDVTLDGDRIDYDKRLAEPGEPAHEEDDDVWLDADGHVIHDMDSYEAGIDACAWDVHVQENLEMWADEILEQVAASLEQEDA